MKMEENIIYKHQIHNHNPKSANNVIPELFKIFEIKSVIDIGCGNGSWLSVFEKLGIEEFIGIDQVDATEKYVQSDKIISADLGNKINLNSKFDLAISLEVAEHIDEKYADTFVENLTCHSDIILFSAAIPNQGGQNHLNEQWIDYWSNKFSKHQFQLYDGFRFLFWGNTNVEWWYQQNMFIFIKNETKVIPTCLWPCDNLKSIRYIHPELYSYRIEMVKKIISKYKIINTRYDNLSIENIGIKSAILILINAFKDKIKSFKK
jgi:hypothetical protein